MRARGEVLLLFVFLSSVAAAETPCPRLKPAELKVAAEKARCFSFDFESKGLKRKIPVNVIVPGGPLEKLPYAIFLHGRGSDREMIVALGTVSAMDAYVGGGGKPFLIVSPSGGDHYWMNAAISKEPWGDLVTGELPKEIEKRFSARGEGRALFGISMGGHGVVQLGLHHPHEFKTVLALSPVFRREADLWHPGATNGQPQSDYDAFGVGAAYRERSPRDLCEKIKKPDGTCLPFVNFRMETGEKDPFLDATPDTRTFINDMKLAHPKFTIGINHCEGQEAPAASADFDAHSYSYWRCKWPSVIAWLGSTFSPSKQALKKVQ